MELIKTGFLPSPKIKRHWNGTVITNLYPLANGLGKIPAGSQLKVGKAGVVTSMSSKPCECCGLEFRIATRQLDGLRILDTELNRDRVKWNKEYKPGNSRRETVYPDWPKPEPEFINQ